MQRTKSRRRHVAALALATAVALVTGMTGSVAVAAEKSRAVSGWFGYWTSPQDMIEIAQGSNGVLGEVNIFWWSYHGSDNPVCTTTLSCPSPSATPWASQALLKSARGLQAQGIEVYATHTDLDGARAGSLSGYLAKKANRRAIADKLTDWAVKSGVDGVDLDWENFAFNDGSSSWATTRPRLTNAVKILGKRLHAQGLKLSVTVPGGYKPFLSDGSPNPGGGYTVYDWAALAPHVDRLRLMTYDYSWDRPGPIGPHGWTRDVARSAVAQVGQENAAKIYIGLHQYGKAWYDRDDSDDYITIGQCDPRWQPDGQDGVSLTPDEAIELAQDKGVTRRFDKPSKEWTFTYTKTEAGHWTNDKGKRRTAECEVQKVVWYGGTRTGVGRMKIVRQTKIGGIAIWNLASLDAGFFPALKPFVSAQNKR